MCFLCISKWGTLLQADSPFFYPLSWWKQKSWYPTTAPAVAMKNKWSIRNLKFCPKDLVPPPHRRWHFNFCEMLILTIYTLWRNRSRFKQKLQRLMARHLIRAAIVPWVGDLRMCKIRRAAMKWPWAWPAAWIRMQAVFDGNGCLINIKVILRPGIRTAEGKH